MKQDSHKERENLNNKNEKTGPLFKLNNDPRVENIMLPIRDGILICQKNLKLFHSWAFHK